MHTYTLESQYDYRKGLSDTVTFNASSGNIYFLHKEKFNSSRPRTFKKYITHTGADTAYIKFIVGLTKSETSTDSTFRFYKDLSFVDMGIPSGTTIQSIRGQFFCRWITLWKKSWDEAYHKRDTYLQPYGRWLRGINKRNLYDAQPNELSCGPLEIRDVLTDSVLYTVSPQVYCGKLTGEYINSEYTYYPKKQQTVSVNSSVLHGAKNWFQSIGTPTLLTSAISSDTTIRLNIGGVFPRSDTMQSTLASTLSGTAEPGNAYNKGVMLRIKAITLYIQYS